MVSPASRMLSAISFGVFCRSAPSTSAIIRSRNVSPGFAVTCTRIQSDSTFVPPVTAERSPPDSRMTGADSPVMALSSTDATPSTISPSAGITSPADTRTMSPLRSDGRRHDLVGPIRALALGDRLGLRPAQRVRLRLAAALGHRFGEVGEEHGQPEPDRDLQLEAELTAAGDEVLDQAERGQHAADLDDEHDRIARHRARMELDERIPDRATDDLRIPDGACLCRH